jgi:hypothetical protein
MYRLNYIIDGKIFESYDFPSWSLANWKKSQFIKAGTHVYGTFEIKFIP